MVAPKIEGLRVRCVASAAVTDFDPLPYPPSPDEFNLRATYVSLNWERTESFGEWGFQSACVTGVLVSTKSYNHAVNFHESTHIYGVEQIQGTWLADLVFIWSPNRGDVVIKKVGEFGDIEIIEP